MADDRSSERRAAADRGKVSLKPLTEDDALRGLLAAKPPAKDAKPTPSKKDKD